MNAPSTGRSSTSPTGSSAPSSPSTGGRLVVRLDRAPGRRRRVGRPLPRPGRTDQPRLRPHHPPRPRRHLGPVDHRRRRRPLPGSRLHRPVPRHRRELARHHRPRPHPAHRRSRPRPRPPRHRHRPRRRRRRSTTTSHDGCRRHAAKHLAHSVDPDHARVDALARGRALPGTRRATRHRPPSRPHRHPAARRRRRPARPATGHARPHRPPRRRRRRGSRPSTGTTSAPSSTSTTAPAPSTSGSSPPTARPPSATWPGNTS